MKREITLELAGPRRARLTFSALESFEEISGTRLEDFEAKGASLRSVRILLYVACRACDPALTLEEFSRALDGLDVAHVAEEFKRLLSVALPEGGAEGNGRGAEAAGLGVESAGSPSARSR